MIKDNSCLMQAENLLQSFLAALPYNFRDRYRIGPLEIVIDEHGKIVKDEHGNIKKSTIKNGNISPEINQFYISKNQNPLQDLIDAYNRIYPNLYDSFEKGYREHVSMKPKARCDHEWETINIHKMGEGYKCHKCLHTIEKEAFKRVFLK